MMWDCLTYQWGCTRGVSMGKYDHLYENNDREIMWWGTHVMGYTLKFLFDRGNWWSTTTYLWINAGTTGLDDRFMFIDMCVASPISGWFGWFTMVHTENWPELQSHISHMIGFTHPICSIDMKLHALICFKFISWSLESLELHSMGKLTTFLTIPVWLPRWISLR